MEVAVSKFNIDRHSTSTTSKGPSENLKRMSWDNLVSPIDAKNSISFFVPFFLGWPGLLGDSVARHKYDQSISQKKIAEILLFNLS